jgi:hypothetical protein
LGGIIYSTLQLPDYCDSDYSTYLAIWSLSLGKFYLLLIWMDYSGTWFLNFNLCCSLLNQLSPMVFLLQGLAISRWFDAICYLLRDLLELTLSFLECSILFMLWLFTDRQPSRYVLEHFLMFCVDYLMYLTRIGLVFFVAIKAIRLSGMFCLNSKLPQVDLKHVIV